MDLQFDATADGRPVKIVSVVDEHTGECLAGLVDAHGDALIEELDRLAGQRGFRAVLRCDKGAELACAAMNEGAGERVGRVFILPGPWRNGYIESFHGRARDECVTINILRAIARHAR